MPFDVGGSGDKWDVVKVENLTDDISRCKDPSGMDFYLQLQIEFRL